MRGTGTRAPAYVACKVRDVQNRIDRLATDHVNHGHDAHMPSVLRTDNHLVLVVIAEIKDES